MTKKKTTKKITTGKNRVKSEHGKTRLISLDAVAQDENRVPVLVVVSGNLLDVGRILPITHREISIGRDMTTDLALNDRLISRKHLEILALKEDNGDFSILVKDLDSTNGTFVKGKRITEEWLRLGETIEIGSETILLFRTESFTCIRNRNLILSMVSKDSLTGVYNRRAFEQLMEHIYDKYQNTNNVYTLVLMDIDHFKGINDTHGHPFGDTILKSIASLLCSEVRADDIVARLGGDEFAIVLPNTGRMGASKLAERLLEKVRKLNPDSHSPVNLTISIGISEDRGSKLKTTEVYRQADVAMYKAKQKGRNTYCIYGQSSGF